MSELVELIVGVTALVSWCVGYWFGRRDTETRIQGHVDCLERILSEEEGA